MFLTLKFDLKVPVYRYLTCKCLCEQELKKTLVEEPAARVDTRMKAEFKKHARNVRLALRKWVFKGCGCIKSPDSLT